MKSINIFISYRRKDSAGHARALYEELKKRSKEGENISSVSGYNGFTAYTVNIFKKAPVIMPVRTWFMTPENITYGD